MRAVIQKVTEASVAVSCEIISKIGQGLCVLVGIDRDDEEEDFHYIINKLLSIKLFSDENGCLWKKNVKDKDLEILLVSQFTLMAATNKGTKPDFRRAMNPDSARALFEQFTTKLVSQYDQSKIQTGKFQSYMNVCINNDGPTTIVIDSKIKDF